MSVASIGTWNYLNPFFEPPSGSYTAGGETTVADDSEYVDDEDDDDYDDEVYTLANETSNEGHIAVDYHFVQTKNNYDVCLNEEAEVEKEPALPKKMAVRKAKKKIFLQNKNTAPQPTAPDSSSRPRQCDAPGAVSGDAHYFGTFLAPARTDAPVRKCYSSRFVGVGLPNAPSLDYEGDESDLAAMFDLPRPPSMIYEYTVPTALLK
jgi:hypothetical protein